MKKSEIAKLALKDADLQEAITRNVEETEHLLLTILQCSGREDRFQAVKEILRKNSRKSNLTYTESIKAFISMLECGVAYDKAELIFMEEPKHGREKTT